MRPLRTALRRLALPVLRWGGVFAVARLLRRAEITILAIHGIQKGAGDAGQDMYRRHLDADVLERHVRLLVRHEYCFITLQDAVDMLAGRRPMQPHAVVVTFDDGYRTQAIEAIPVLRRHGVPATVFVCPGHIDSGKLFWWDCLDYAFHHLTTDTLIVNDGTREQRYPCGDAASRRASFYRLRSRCKRLGRDRLRDIVEQVEAQASGSADRQWKSDDRVAMLTWDDVAAVAGNGVEIGSHTVNHVLLGDEKRDTVQSELEQSKQAIESNTGPHCDSLCYPDGSFNDETVELARQSGYRCAVTLIEGFNKKGADPFRLRRLTWTREDSGTELLAQLSGVSLVWLRLRRWSRGIKAATHGLDERELG